MNPRDFFTTQICLCYHSSMTEDGTDYIMNDEQRRELPFAKWSLGLSGYHYSEHELEDIAKQHYARLEKQQLERTKQDVP
ncbi:MAG: hypothetical protein R3E01_10410 [Pirellulaceae bacterium]